MTGQRLANLGAALGFLRLPPTEPELRLLHRWLDTWSGVGLIAVRYWPIADVYTRCGKCLLLEQKRSYFSVGLMIGPTDQIGSRSGNVRFLW